MDTLICSGKRKGLLMHQMACKCAIKPDFMNMRQFCALLFKPRPRECVIKTQQTYSISLYVWMYVCTYDIDAAYEHKIECIPSVGKCVNAPKLESSVGSHHSFLY